MNWAILLSENTLALTAPLALAAMGGFTSERGGVINIALEGNMLIAAITTALLAISTHNPWLGLLGGISASTMLSWLHWLLTQGFRIDHIVSGMAVNALAFGGANFLDKRFGDPTGGKVPSMPVEFFYLSALLLPLGLMVYMNNARGGLRLKAVGSDPSKCRQMGISPTRVRFVALTATGIFCGISGALIVMNARYYTDQMTAGRGFIALAALILGSWRPVPALLACVVFGFFQGLQIQLQGVPLFGLHVPREVWFSLPYIVAVAALAGFIGPSRPPAGLGKY